MNCASEKSKDFDLTNARLKSTRYPVPLVRENRKLPGFTSRCTIPCKGIKKFNETIPKDVMVRTWVRNCGRQSHLLVQICKGFEQAISIKLKLLYCDFFPQYLSRRDHLAGSDYVSYISSRLHAIGRDSGPVSYANDELMQCNVTFKPGLRAFQCTSDPKMNHFKSTQAILHHDQVCKVICWKRKMNHPVSTCK